MRAFLGNLSWSLLSGILASVVMLIVNILVGRWLGPEAYGGYNSILSLASILAIIFLSGFDASSVRYLSDRKYSDIYKNIFTTSLLSVVFTLIFGALIILLIYGFFESSLSVFISRQFLILSILFAIVLALKNLFNGFLRAFHRYKTQGVIRFLDAVFVITLFLILVLGFKETSYRSYIYALSFGGFFFIIVAFFTLRKFFLSFDYSILKKMFFEYNRFLLLASIICIILASDKFIIGKLLGMKELGYYGAYYTASHLIIAELGGVFMNVFWPSVIKNAISIKSIIQKIERIFIFYSPLWIVLITLNTFIFFSLFGNDYPLRLDYLILFSINTFFGFLFSIFLSFLNIHHIKRSIAVGGIFAVVSVGTLVLFKSIIIYVVIQIFLQAILIYKTRIFLTK